MFRLVSVLVLVATLWPASAWAAYVTPTSRSTGFVVTAARWNQDVVDNMIAVRTALLDSVTNETAATDMTITATGDEIIFADQIKLLGTTSDPTNEQDVSYDSTDGVMQAKYKVGRVRIPGCWSTQTTDSSAIANTVVETSFSQLPPQFPANSLVAGTTISWDANYMYSTTGTPTLRIRHKLAGSSTATISDPTGFTTASGVTNQHMYLHGELTILTAGASGTYRCVVYFAPIGSGAVSVASGGPTSQFGSVTGTIDTTQANTLTDTMEWGTASASNTIKRLQLRVQVQ